MNWSIVNSNNEFILEPSGWNAEYFSKKIAENGTYVSLPLIAPASYLVINNIRILPVEDDPVIPSDQEIISRTYTVGSIIVSVSVMTQTKPTPSSTIDEFTLRRWELENKYLETTKQLILLAGRPDPGEWIKLEDTEYEIIAQEATLNNPGVAALLVSTIMYAFFQLKMLNVRWEDIVYHNEIV